VSRRRRKGEGQAYADDHGWVAFSRSRSGPSSRNSCELGRGVGGVKSRGKGRLVVAPAGFYAEGSEGRSRAGIMRRWGANGSLCRGERGTLQRFARSPGWGRGRFRSRERGEGGSRKLEKGLASERSRARRVFVGMTSVLEKTLSKKKRGERDTGQQSSSRTQLKEMVEEEPLATGHAHSR